MMCDDARGLVCAWLDGELDRARQLDVEAHLAGCPPCAGVYSAERGLQAAIRAPELRFRAPAELSGRVRRAVAAARPRLHLAGLPVRAWAGVVSIAALIVLAVYLPQVLRSRPEQATLAQEIVTAHIRSLMPGHLADVPSTDQHTVKPWFAGRVDFSPPVPNLDADGFLLAGGRLDYVGGRSVAALVYRRRQHVLNVFVWPSSNESPQATWADRGYNVRWWGGAGIECWVVSDLNSSELDEFVRVFRAAEAGARPR